MTRAHSRLALILAATLLIARTATAQTAPPRGFAGAGLGLLAQDSLNVSRSADDWPPHTWFVEAGAFVGARVAVGGELFRAPTRSASYSSSAGILTEDLVETSLLGVVRVRTTRPGRIAFDLLGGGGILLQRHALSSISASSPTRTPVESDVMNRAPVFVLGGDLPIAVATHVAIVPSARFYLFQRAVAQNVLVEAQPSTSLALGISGRVMW